MAGSSPRPSGTVCASCGAHEEMSGAQLFAALGCTRYGVAEVEPRVVWLRLWRWVEKLAERAALHQVGFDQPGEGERALDDLVGVVSQAQQQEGDQGDGDLDADRG